MASKMRIIGCLHSAASRHFRLLWNESHGDYKKQRRQYARVRWAKEMIPLAPLAARNEWRLEALRSCWDIILWGGFAIFMLFVAAHKQRRLGLFVT